MHELLITWFVRDTTHTHIDNNRREKGTSTLDVYSQGGQTVS